MSEQLKEALSAAMDDEADAFELRRVLDESAQNGELREQWHRMHLLRDVLQDEQFYDGRDLRQRILAEMAASDAPSEVAQLTSAPVIPPVRQANWLGRIAGSAVAIAVAALVVINADSFLPNGQENSLEVAEINTAPVVTGTPVLYPEATQADHLRLDRHRMRHYQQNAINKAGAVSFVRMMTFKQSRAGKKGETTQRQRSP